MSLLSILKAVLSLANLLAKMASDRQLLQAGEYKAIAEANENALKAIKKAQNARDAVKPATPDELRDDPQNRDRT